MRLSLLIPTRSRPNRLKHALESARRLAKEPFEVLTYVDSDDPKKDQYEDVYIGPPVGTSKALLYLISQVKTPFFMIGSDDIEFRTQDWDEKLLDAFPKDRLAVVYGKDNYKDNCNHFVMSREWVDLVGAWPDKFYHFGPDGWVAEVAKAAGVLIKVPDVIIEHLHFKVGKAEKDDTYIRTRNGGGPNAAVFIQNNRALIEEHAERIKCRK